MKCTIPEISWHNRDPVLSIDIQPQRPGEDFYRLASGGTDSHVLIWHVRPSEDGSAAIEFASDLVRHQKAVNAVRFSPSGEFLASGDDESAVIIWKKRLDTDAPELSGQSDTEVANKESWMTTKILRGHLEDVYDISWSPDSAFIISGSVDNTAIIWDIIKGTKLGILDDHKGFVQGVAWDPKGNYIATLSSDRKLRVFNASNRKVVARVGKSLLPVPKGHELEGKNLNLFHDDTIQTFFRRLCFSPDGEMIIAPAGVIEAQEPGKKPTSTTLVFSRRLLNRPVMYLPSLDQYSVCVRCCPVQFELRNLDPSTKPESMFLLPYRVIFAVATASAVVLYDTQQPMPFGYISNLHYTRLTDLAWSPKGDMLMVSSTDGYCSIITFSPDELGTVYQPKGNVPVNVSDPVLSKVSETATEKIQTPANTTTAKTPDKEDSTADQCQEQVKKFIRQDITTTQVNDCEIVELMEDSNPESVSQAKREVDTESGSLVDSSNIPESAQASDECSNSSLPKPDTSKTPDPKKAEDKVSLIEHTITPDCSDKITCGPEKTNSPDRSDKNTSDPEKTNTPDRSDKNTTGLEKRNEQAPNTAELSQLSISDKVVTPNDSAKKARRVQLITLSSPKSKKKLL